MRRQKAILTRRANDFCGAFYPGVRSEVKFCGGSLLTKRAHVLARTVRVRGFGGIGYPVLPGVAHDFGGEAVKNQSQSWLAQSRTPPLDFSSSVLLMVLPVLPAAAVAGAAAAAAKL